MENLQIHDLNSEKPWTSVSLPTETFGTQECPTYTKDKTTSGKINIQKLEGWKKHRPDKEELIQLKEKKGSNLGTLDNSTAWKETIDTEKRRHFDKNVHLKEELDPNWNKSTTEDFFNSKLARKSEKSNSKGYNRRFGCIILQIASYVGIPRKEKKSKGSTKSTVKDIDDKEEEYARYTFLLLLGSGKAPVCLREDSTRRRRSPDADTPF